METRFATNGDVRIRFFDSGPSGPQHGLPVVFVPGISDVIEDYETLPAFFEPRRLVIVELRGRGGSDVPEKGYSAATQAGDVFAVLDATGVERFHLMTFSRGTTPALEVAFAAAERIVTVSIGDYRAAEIKMTDTILEGVWSSTWRGTPVSSRVARTALEGIRDDCSSRQLYEPLAALGVPVLVARPAKDGIVDDATEQTFRQTVPGVEILTVSEHGHDIFRQSRTAYPEAVLDFIARRAPGT